MCNGFEPYFCKKKNIGELDFLIEMDGKVTYLPIYMCYLVKEQSIGQLIVDLDMEGCEEPRVHQKNRSFVINI